MFRYLIPLLCCLPVMGLGSAQAAPSCATLAEDAGQKLGVPSGLMAAISLVETGTGGQSWPWTLNEGGKGMHFDTKDEALAYLRDAVNRGVTNIDVGCMQLNFRWHASGFVSLEDMIDPSLNTRYAALFLTELKKRLGSWEDATANYHSADAERGVRYQAKVAQAMGQDVPDVQGQDMAQMEQDAPEQESGVVTGILLSGGQPLVMVAPDGVMADDPVQMAALEMKEPRISERPVILRNRKELPARLGNRWAAVQAAREQLSGN